jgi:hypothetical protein
LKIELIYDEICPNFEAARKVLKLALDELGLPLVWQEWKRSENCAPAFVYQFGSPTILINGMDVGGLEAQSPVSCCRLYQNKAGHLEKVPDVEQIVQAILQADDSQ